MPHVAPDNSSPSRPNPKRWCQRILVLLWMLIPSSAIAQCEMENKAFRSGEEINYDLYFNWKFVWKKVGYARFTTQSTHYLKEPAYRIDLLTATEGIVDRFFRMRDTLSSVVTKQLLPQHYRKAAYEGKNYYIDEAFFDYSNHKVHAKMTQIKNITNHYQGEKSSNECIFDMLSIMARARSWNTHNFKEGHRIRFLMVDAEKVVNEIVVYRGKEVVSSKDGQKYRCLVFSFYEDKEEKKDKELIRFFITDDANHLPIRLDMNLNFGSAKAFMRSVKNNRYPLTSLVK